MKKIADRISFFVDYYILSPICGIAFFGILVLQHLLCKVIYKKSWMTTMKENYQDFCDSRKNE